MAGSNEKLEKRPVTLGEYDEETDTYEILDGLKSSDYIVWPSEDCQKGVTVYKNDGSMMIPSGDNMEDIMTEMEEMP